MTVTSGKNKIKPYNARGFLGLKENSNVLIYNYYTDMIYCQIGPISRYILQETVRTMYQGRAH